MHSRIGNSPVASLLVKTKVVFPMVFPHPTPPEINAG
jgi:hypothetical protein